MIRMTFTNRMEAPYYLQIEPFATVYLIQKGEAVEIEIEEGREGSAFDLDEGGDTKYLTLLHCTEYFIHQDGKRMHWTEFQSNFPPREHSQTSVG